MESVREVLDLLSVHAVELDRRNRVRWMSRAALEANRLTIARVRGAALSSLWPESAPEWLPLIEAVRRTGRPATRLEYAATLPGAPMWSHVTRMPTGTGGVLVVAEDVTGAIRFAACERAIQMFRADPLSISRLD